MKLQEFIDKWNNKTLDYDHVYGGQCVDVFKQYNHDLGGPEVHGNAIDYWTKYPPIYEKIANTPANFPLPGDVVIWGTQLGQYGHIAICQTADANKLTCFGQNFPLNSKCHLQLHSYKGIIGWLRPKSTPIPVPTGPWHVPLTIVGADIHGLADQVLKWSRNTIILDIKSVPMLLPYNPTFNYATLAMDRFCVISCDPAPQIYRTTLTDNLQTAYAVAGPDALASSYEFSHILHKYYLAHRGSNPYIEIEDTVGGVTDDQRYHKFDVLKPYMNSVVLK